MKIRKIIALVLCFALFCTLFAGCGKDDAQNAPSGGDSSSESGGKNPSADKKDEGKVEELKADTSYAEFVYVPTYKDLPLPEGANVNNLYLADDKFVLVCNEVIGQRTETWGEPDTEEYQEYTYDVYGTALYTMNRDFSDLKRLDNYTPTAIPEGSQGNCYLSTLTVCGDGTFWTFENRYLYTIDENGEYIDGGDTVIVRHIASDGSEICNFEASTLFPDAQYLYIDAAKATDDGGCVIADGSDNQLAVVDAQGNKLFTIDMTSYISNFVTLADGNIYAGYYGDKGYCIAPLDLTAKKFGEEIPLPPNAWNIIPGDSNYDIYFNNELELCGYDFETQTTSTVINWLSSDINPDELNNLTVLPDGSICAIFYDYSGEYSKCQVATFTKADPATLPAKITLTLGCMYVDYNVRREVINFNRNNDTYRIEIVDYSQYNTDDDYTAGTTKLNTEIISGKAPDILVSSDLPMEMYAKKGLFVDLYTLIDSDSELSRDALVMDILKALEIDGKLYTATSSVIYQTVVAPTSVVGPEPGWTIDKLMELQRTMPAGMNIFVNATRSDMLNRIIRMNLDSYIDWTTGECKFDTGEFAKMLEFANTFPLEFNWETEYKDDYSSVSSGETLLLDVYLERFDGLLMYKCLYNGDITCIGFPSENTCGTIIQPETSLAISSTCKAVDGAWEFVRSFFTEEYQNENVWWGFKTNMAAFKADMANQMQRDTYTDENGNEVEYPRQDWEGEGYHILTYAPTQEEVDQVLALIKAVGESGVKYTWDEDIFNIINTESDYYFNGQKSADEVASIIQSRVKIFVSEHML